MVQKILTVRTEGKGWVRLPGLNRRLETVAAVTLGYLPAKFRFPATVTLLLTGNGAIRRLNRDFRGVDKPTNVLSFPQFEPSKLGKFRGQKGPVELGDIAIAYQYMVAEAKKDHKILINHVIHLFIHGLLHLFGYDHLLDNDAVRMEWLEVEIMSALDLPDPYADQEMMEPKRRRLSAKTRRARKHPRP